MVLFLFVGIEMIGVIVGEIKDLEKIIFKVINSVFIRILIFYVGVLVVIMFIILWDKVDLDNSLFVRLFVLIGILFVVGIINFVVLIVVVFLCNSGIFLNSRMFYGFLN